MKSILFRVGLIILITMNLAIAVGAFDSYLRARREEELMAFGVAQDTALQINPTDDEEQTE